MNLKRLQLLVLFVAMCAPASAWALGPGRVDVPLVAGQSIDAGMVTVHNNNGGLLVDVQPANGWRLKALHVEAGWSGDPLPLNKVGLPVVGQFRFSREYAAPVAGEPVWFDFVEGLDGFRWGGPYEAQRTRYIAVHADVVQVDPTGKVIASEGAWAFGNRTFAGGWGRWFKYEMAHKGKAHFVDSPVEGLRVVTPTFEGHTDASGGFEAFFGEDATFYLGTQLLGRTAAEHRITPIDLFDGAGFDDVRVGNMARLLQTLDADGDPKPGISVTPAVLASFERALAAEGPITDWHDSTKVDRVIAATLADALANGLPLVEVSMEAALENLTRTVSSSMFRKNVSRTPDQLTEKVKLETAPLRIPARKANGDLYPEGIDYYDDAGNFLYNRTTAVPLIAAYKDGDAMTGAGDIWGAISRDDGATWKRMNLSRAADLSSFTLANGLPYYGDTMKPVIAVRENYIFVAWQSKFCRGGRPRYSRPETDPYYADDIWGVGGPQRSHDYTEEGFPEVGELPFFCVWVTRGVIDPATGDISWRKPERLTSGRRDAYQISVHGQKGVGFSIVWQEDPEGVRPGEAAGPGHGWSGATTNHTTDVWYSSIAWADFATLDANFVPNGDPEHSYDDPEWTSNRPMPLVPFALPHRLTDNDTCNTDNMKVEVVATEADVHLADGTVARQTAWLPPQDGDGKYVFTPIQDPLDPEWDGKHAGTHRYCYVLDENGNGVPDLCANFYSFVNSQGATKSVCITEDGRLLDADVGASRANINVMPKSGGAWVNIAYEETKGVGTGRVEWDDDDDTTHEEEKAKPDLGKNVIYHSFDFANPNRVSAGTIVNLPTTDVDGNVLYLCESSSIGCALGATDLIPDWQGNLQFAYENARRPRMLVQPAGQVGSSNTVMVLLYKQGEEGKGRPSDIFMRRMVNPKDGTNPYAAKNILPGAQNISSVEPTEYWINPDQDADAKGEGIKVVKFRQTVANLAYQSATNPYEDARAHRGILRGDALYIAYDHTPNWAASRNAHDKYDLYVRRSFDGGQTFTTDPLATGEICHTRIWKDYTTVVSEDEANRKDTYEEVECFLPGVYEPARNMSMLKNNKLSVIEPRLVGTPGTILSGLPEDVSNRDVFYVTFGTEENVPKAHGNVDEEEEQALGMPADIYYTYTRDRGQTYFKRLWSVNPDSSGNYAGTVVERYDYLAKGDPAQAEAQIRMSPDGSKFHATWNEEALGNFDAWYRRIMSSGFPQNVAVPEAP